MGNLVKRKVERDEEISQQLLRLALPGASTNESNFKNQRVHSKMKKPQNK